MQCECPPRHRTQTTSPFADALVVEWPQLKEDEAMMPFRATIPYPPPATYPSYLHYA